MAQLTSCKYCGSNISSEAKNCPNCGLCAAGYFCLICEKEITSPTDPNETTLEQVSFWRLSDREYGYHQSCLQQIRELMYACPVCNESFSLGKMGKKWRNDRRENIRTRETGQKSTFNCRNCGHPIEVEQCHCLEPVANDGISGVTYLTEDDPKRKYDSRSQFKTRTIHKICAQRRDRLEAGVVEYRDGLGGKKITENVYKNKKRKKSEKNQCFIATAVYGLHSAEVKILREFRDRSLAINKLGQVFIKSYEYLSPPLAQLIARNEKLRSIVKIGVVIPMLWIVKKVIKPR